MPPSVSVVVPTLNEERALPQLLRALAGQTRPAGELIVADGGSADGTRGLAAAAGARVVPGGTPAVGRNRGAAAAAAPLVVFLDADVVPPPRFLEVAVGEFEARRLDVATCLAVPLSRWWVDRALHGATNAYYLATAGFAPHGSGFCLLARKALHEAIRGFAEHLTSGEDHDYARRGAARGRYAVLRRVAIPVSVRRLDQQGRAALVGAYLAAEFRREVGQPSARLLRRHLGRRPERPG